MLAHLQMLKDVHQRCQMYITHMTLVRIVKKAWAQYAALRDYRYLQQQILASSLKVAYKLKFQIKRRGRDYSARVRSQVRDCLNFYDGVQRDRNEARAKECILWFMGESA